MAFDVKAFALATLAWTLAVPAAGAQPVAGAGQPAGTAVPDGRADAPYVQMMLWHGQRLVELAEIGLGRASAAELRFLVERLVSAQLRDLEDLQRLQKSFVRAGGEQASPARTTDAAEDDPDTLGMMERLRGTAEGEFDSLFLSTLIAHEDMGVQLSRNPARFASADLRAFAKRYLQRNGSSLKQLRLLQRGS